MSYLIVIIIIVVLSFVVDVYLIKRNKKPDGTIVIISNDGKKLFSLELGIDPDDILPGDYVLFKVVDESTEELE
jgi:hypothetical protein